jgi:hypothetical protein
LGGLAIGHVELRGEFLHFLLPICLPIQDAAHIRTSLLPRLALQQLGARVSPTFALGHKNVPPMQTILQALERAERVEAGIGNIIGQHQLVPVLRYHSHRGLLHGTFALALPPPQELQSLDHRISRNMALKPNHSQQHGKETPHVAVMIDQLIEIAGLVFAATDLADCDHIFFQLLSGNRLKNSSP